MREIFGNFEVNQESRLTILSRLVTASLVFHTLVLASVLYVPSVRDSLNIAALLSRTDYVDRAYTKTQIGDDVQVVEVAKFRYPDGYFATESPSPAIDPGASPSSGFSFSAGFVPPVSVESPSPSPVPSPEASPTSSPAASPGSITVAGNNANNDGTDSKEPTEVDKELDQIAEENGVVRPSRDEVNTRPLKDWLAKANLLREKGGVELTSRIEITIAANLGTDCKLTEARVVQKSGDARLLEVAKELVSAVGDSGMLSFLRDPEKVQDVSELRCDGMPLQMTIRLDQNEIAATVESQAASPARAAQMARGYSGLLAIGQYLKRGKDEEMLYKSTKVTSEGNQVLVNFSMPRQAAGELLKKQLPPAG